MHKIQLPLQNKQRLSLQAGMQVLLSGTVYTARDCAHKKLITSLFNGEKLPISLENAAIYYAGPCPTPPNKPSGSCGPTTSMRMDSYTTTLIENGLRITIGKGERSKQVIDTIKKYKAVYFAAIGGAGALYGNCIQKNECIAYPTLFSEAIYQLEIKDFPCIVAIDANGNTIFQDRDINR